MKALPYKIYNVVSTFLLGLLVTGTVIASQNQTAISNALGTPNFRVENTGDTNVDSEYFKSKYSSLSDLIKAGRDLVEEVEGEGAVLLKNDNNTLPLAKGSKISLFSVSSVKPAYGGRGSAQTSFPQTPVTPKEGFENAGFLVNETLNNFYQANASKYVSEGRGEDALVKDAPWNDIVANNLTSSINEYGDAAFFIVTRVGGEGSDLSSKNVADGTDGDHLKLSINERSVLKGLKELKDAGKIKKIVVLLNTSNQIQSSYLVDPELGVDAALWIGSVGVTGFNAVGKLVSGDIVPSGHLSDAHWYNHNDNPVNKNFGAYTYAGVNDYNLPIVSGKVDGKYSSYDVYQEGVYLGYRYAETRYADVVANRTNAGSFTYKDVISHPFGYGSSYTEFDFSNFTASKLEDSSTYEITVDVENIGSTYSGKDVVQIYLQKPYTSFDIERGIEKPAVELVGFAKTSILAPGEKETVSIKVDESEFRVYDANVDKTYIITEGDYYLTAATDSHNAINNILAYQNYTNLDDVADKEMVAKYSLSYDKETYSKSSKTNEKITNLFDQSDINKYSGKNKNSVTYVSRNNWTGTLPTTNVVLSMTSALQKDLLAQDTPKNIVGDKKGTPSYGKNNGLQLINLRVDDEGNEIEYKDPLWDRFLDQLSFEETSALLSNGLRQTAVLDRLGKPKTLDHNGPAGLTERYGANPYGLASRTNDPNKEKTAPYYPCAGIIAATFNVDIAKKFGDMLGEDAIWAGYAGFYGIGINTHRSPYEGRAYEYFSEDPFLAGIIATEEVKALQSHGCNAYIKHFALNEQESRRNGVSIWLNEQTLREIYLRPFEKTVIDGDAMNAMASFTRIGAKYCPASKELLTDFLRGELGMKGLVVTDMYSIGYRPEHMPTFMMAGVDIPDGELINPYKGFEKNYEFTHRMREAAKRVFYSTVHSNAMNGISKNTRLIEITPSWMIALVSIDGVVAALWLTGVSLAVVAAIKSNKQRKEKED